MRIWGAILTSQEKRCKTHSFPALVLFLLCLVVYMQSNAWQRSYVRSHAIKKSLRGQRGKEKKASKGGGGGGWRRQRRRLFFLRSKAAEQSRHGKAGEWENGTESDGIAPRAKLPKPCSQFSSTRLRPIRFPPSGSVC